MHIKLTIRTPLVLFALGFLLTAPFAHAAEKLDKVSLSFLVDDLEIRRGGVAPNIAFGMEGVLKLYFGESNQPTPEFIHQAAIKAMRDGFTTYSENAGMLSLREAIAAHYERLHGVSLDPRREIIAQSFAKLHADGVPIEQMGGSLVRREVRVGRQRDGRVEIAAGLAPGESYVEKGAILLLNAVDLAKE